MNKIIDEKILKDIFPPRPKNNYFRKYDFGLVLIIGGGEFYSGSPALSGFAALRTGCDMVQIIAPKRAADIVASFSPDLAAYPLKGKRLEQDHLPILLSLTESAKEVSRGNIAVLIGGGLGRSEETKETVRAYLKEMDVPVVIDADGIYAISQEPRIVFERPFLITPHSYEFFVLTKREIFSLSPEERIEVVEEEAKRLQTTILLKQKPDIVSNGKETVLNTAGSPYMSVAGMGDTLAGICAALMSRGFSPFLSAQVGVFVVCKAGELVEKSLREGMLATDVIDAIPKVLHPEEK